MAKNINSMGGLINMKVLNKLIKQADPLIVGQDDWMTYICNGHWLVRLVLTDEDVDTKTAIFKALGELPAHGHAIRKGKGQSAVDFNLESLKDFFRRENSAICSDTRMSVEIINGHELRIFKSVPDDDEVTPCYVCLDKEYFSMLADYHTALSEKCSSRLGILFLGNCDEAAFILPVGIIELPYMKEL